MTDWVSSRKTIVALEFESDLLHGIKASVKGKQARPLGSLDGTIGPDQHQGRLEATDPVVIRNSQLKGLSEGLQQASRSSW